jgi:DNA-binding GntR family transcriptional regulator
MKMPDGPAMIGYIVEYRERNGMPPSVREIAERFGVAHGTAQNALRRMMDEGLLRRPPGVARGIQISEAGMKMLTETL